MIQYTTPTITVTIAGVALADTDEVWLTLQPQSKGNLTGEALTVEDPTVRVEGTDTIVSVTLTQEQSAMLPKGSCYVQVNWLSSDGTRCATTRGNVMVQENLLPEVKTRA